MTTTMIRAMPVDGCAERGAWLVEHRWEMDRGECSWLLALADFDTAQGWAADGQLSAVAWLMWRTDMARPTAYEKLRIAGQLRARPAIADAFSQGRLSYSAVRAITRIDGPDPAVDTALIDLAEAGTVTDVEHAVRFYQLHADQHRPPPDPDRRRGLRICRHGDGTTTVTVTLTDVEAEEIAATLQAFLDRHTTPTPAPETAAESPAGDNPRASEDTDDPDPAGETGEESPAGDSSDVNWPARRADAFMDLARTALAHAGAGHAMGADRYLVHLLAHPDSPLELLDGTPIHPATATHIACDTSTVDHTGGDLGRKTRVWSTGQRRTILIRDRGTCRFPGCTHRITDIHHRQPWHQGGPTDVGNGMLACARHHTLLHRGFQAVGDTNHTLTFHRPDGTTLGTTTPKSGPASGSATALGHWRSTS